MKGIGRRSHKGKTQCRRTQIHRRESTCENVTPLEMRLMVFVSNKCQRYHRADFSWVSARLQLSTFMVNEYRVEINVYKLQCRPKKYSGVPFQKFLPVVCSRRRTEILSCFLLCCRILLHETFAQSDPFHLRFLLQGWLQRPEDRRSRRRAFGM